VPSCYASINRLVKNAVARTGANPAHYSAHGLRAGFVTYANLMGQSDRAIARQTRHRSLASLGPYVRIADVWTNNPAVCAETRTTHISCIILSNCSRG
jgi:integrase